MPAITEREFKVTYELGMKVYNREINKTDAIIKLVDDYQMNESSASMSIQFLNDLLTPKEIRRTLSIAHVGYYANRVFEDYGQEKLKTFLKGLEYHIDYRQANGVNVPGFCNLHNEFSRKIGLAPRF